MKLIATRTFPLSPTKKVARNEPFTVSDELGARLIERGDATAATNPVRPTKPSRIGKGKPSSSSRPARARKASVSKTPAAEPTS